VIRFSAISLMCSAPSVHGKISTTCAKSTADYLTRIRITDLGVAVKSMMIWIAFLALASSADATCTVPRPSEMIFTPVCSMIPRITRALVQ